MPLDFQVALMSAWEEVAHACEKNHRGHSAFSLLSHRDPSSEKSHLPF